MSTLSYFLLAAMAIALLVLIGESCFKLLEWLIVIAWKILKTAISCLPYAFKREPKRAKPESVSEIAIKRLMPGSKN